jgi:hypothetical protein
VYHPLPLQLRSLRVRAGSTLCGSTKTIYNEKNKKDTIINRETFCHCNAAIQKKTSGGIQKE